MKRGSLSSFPPWMAPSVVKEQFNSNVEGAARQMSSPWMTPRVTRRDCVKQGPIPPKKVKRGSVSSPP
ncbi:hypothetical protein E2C01_074954 [Portunus trituberculatus]|uniref:Uncharacterized protein n=1 Tax=Portunus trituberculatus TaxID=210409 RepID=A0A5B7IEI6_PORTR|nr:hypothetical protein [Portunus trituberculatus]